MPLQRPTFHEAWYRVAGLRARLSLVAKVSRQSYRGQIWYVLENTSSNEYFRLNRGAYWFVALLDGRRTVEEAWRICNERLGDEAPTQGEAIQILGMLYANGLLYAEVPPDTQALFKRYKTRIRRQVQGVLMSLLYLKVPLLDPDPILERWSPIVGLAFSPLGALIWLGLVIAGLWTVIGNIPELLASTNEVLSFQNLPWLYLALVIAKVIHEFSHAFACKWFGRANPTGGQVHSMGLMFMVFLPIPYVDTSSAWVFRNKWHRAVVGMAGVLAEWAVAAIAAMIWVHVSPGTLKAVCYNVMFIASLSTILFNGNPLLRFDAYYVLSDLIEIPNLGQRANAYLGYLIRRYIWAVRPIEPGAYSIGEAIWFVFYGISSFVYRVFIFIRILLFMNSRLPEALWFIIPVMAASGLAAWVIVPTGRIGRYLLTNPELAKRRTWAIGSTCAMVAAAVVLVGLVRMPDPWPVEGIVEPNRMAVVYALADGFVQEYLPSGQDVDPQRSTLISAINPSLESQRRQLHAQRRRLEIQRQIAQTEEVALVQILDEQVQAVQQQIERVERDLTNLRLRPPIGGTWVSPDIDRIRGLYVQRGQQIGYVASLDDIVVRATAGQDVAAMILEQADKAVQIRPRGYPQHLLSGRLVEIWPAGTDRLPSAAMGVRAGGEIPVRPDDPNGLQSAERIFQILVSPEGQWPQALKPGHRVTVRVYMRPKPLVARWWTQALQVFQRRFHI